MKGLSDKYLDKIISSKLRGFEAEPDKNSWDKIVSKLPPDEIDRPIHGTRTLLITYCFLLIFSGFILYERVTDDSIKTVQSNHIIGLQPNTDKSKMENQQVTDLDFLKDSRSVKNATRNKPANDSVLISTLLPALVQQLSNISVGKDLQEEVDSVVLSANQIEINPNQLISKDWSLHKSDSLRNSLNEVTFIGILDSSEVNTIKKDRSLQKQKTGWILKINPFYGMGIYNPNKNDNIQVKDFKQSSSLFKNRLGISIGVGYRHPILPKLVLEYSMGYKIFSKQFNYKRNEVGNERSILSVQESVSGIASTISFSITAKTSWIFPKYPILFYVGYDQMIGKGKISELVGHQVMYQGLGVEKTFAPRLTLRPMVLYGKSLGGGNSDTFSIRPVQWGIEAIVGLN
jgi:hypothetical protein